MAKYIYVWFWYTSLASIVQRKFDLKDIRHQVCPQRAPALLFLLECAVEEVRRTHCRGHGGCLPSLSLSGGPQPIISTTLLIFSEFIPSPPLGPAPSESSLYQHSSPVLSCHVGVGAVCPHFNNDNRGRSKFCGAWMGGSGGGSFKKYKNIFILQNLQKYINTRTPCQDFGRNKGGGVNSSIVSFPVNSFLIRMNSSWAMSRKPSDHPALTGQDLNHLPCDKSPFTWRQILLQTCL